MVDVNTKHAEPSLSSLIEQVEQKREVVKLYHDDKVVAEIVPAAEAKYRPRHALHQTSETETSYRTLGETLLKRPS